MKKQFRVSLGLNDARACSLACGGVTIDATKCRAGETVDLPDAVVEWLEKKYKAIFVDPEEVKAVAKKPELTAPAK